MKAIAFGPGSQADLTILTEQLTLLLKYVTSREKVLEFRTEDELASTFSDPIPIEGAPTEDVVKLVWNSIVRGSISQYHPNYLAFPDSGNSIAGLLGELFGSVLNQNLIAVTKSAPTGTFVEMQVIRWLRDLIGYDIGEQPTDATELAGIMVPGGVAANTVALLAARTRAYPRIRKSGLLGMDRPPAVFIPGETMSHYSHAAGSWWLGLGEDSLVPVDVEDNYSMSVAHLQECLNASVKNGRRPVVIVCQAGDSRTMTIDSLNELADLARHFGVWLHVDACHGGSLLFSAKLRRKLAGIERADSVAIDPHKGLCLPYSCSALLFKESNSLRALAKATDITIQQGSLDLGQITPFAGSRRFDSLKIWILLQHIGRRKIGELVDQRHDLALFWKSLVDDSKLYVSLNEVSINSVVFSLSAQVFAEFSSNASPAMVGRANAMIHDRVYRDGRCCVHIFDICDYGSRLGFDRGVRVRVLGVTLGNPLTDRETLKNVFTILEAAAMEVIAGLQS